MNNFCFLLTTSDEIKQFILFEDNNCCDIFSLLLDGQKVFLIKIMDQTIKNKFIFFMTKPNQTFLGCEDISNISLKKENLDTLKLFLEKTDYEKVIGQFNESKSYANK